MLNDKSKFLIWDINGFYQKEHFSPQGGPHVCPGVWLQPDFETHQLLISTLLGWEEEIPKQEAEGQRFMPVSLSSFSCQMQLGLSWNKFFPTNSPPDHQLRRANEEFVVKSWSQTTQSFLCQVSLHRGRSQPLLTSHPWLPEKYFLESNHETRFLSPTQSRAQRAMIKSLSKWKIFYAYSRKCDPSEMSWQVLSLPTRVSTRSLLPLDLESDKPKPQTGEEHPDSFAVDTAAWFEDSTCWVRLPGLQPSSLAHWLWKFQKVA